MDVASHLLSRLLISYFFRAGGAGRATCCGVAVCGGGLVGKRGEGREEGGNGRVVVVGGGWA